MTERERRFHTVDDIEVREDASGLTLRGHAAVFNTLSEPLFGFQEQIAKGAFARTVKGGDIRLLVNHDGVPLARTKSGTLAAREDRQGLYVEAPLDGSNPTVQELASAMRRGDIDQMSFGFQTMKDEWDYEAEPVIRTLREVKLFDVSVVTFPAYEATSAELNSFVPLEVRQMAQRAVDTSTWDGSKALGECSSASDYRSICAGEHSVGQPDERQHWALPHHYLGKGPNEDGVRNALSRLPQTQDLTDEAGAKAHLEAHMKVINPDSGSNSIDVPDLQTQITMFEEELRVGKTLSTKSREAITAAMQALQDLLEAADPSEDNALDVEFYERRLALRRRRLAA